MMRRTMLALAFAILTGAVARAETYGDKLKAVDLDKRTLTLPVEGKDRTFQMDDKVDVQSRMRVGKKLRVAPLKEGLKGVKAGSEVSVTTEKKDGAEVVTKIVVLVSVKP